MGRANAHGTWARQGAALSVRNQVSSMLMGTPSSHSASPFQQWMAALEVSAISTARWMMGIDPFLRSEV